MNYISKLKTQQSWPDVIVWLANTYGRAGDRWNYVEPVMVDTPSFKFVTEEDKIFFDLVWL